MGHGWCADAQGEVINYYSDDRVSSEQCKQHCTEMGETCIGYTKFDLGMACLLHVSEQTDTPEGFVYHEIRPYSNEAISVQTLNTAGSHWGFPKTDFSCFKKTTANDDKGESGNNLLA